METVYFIGIPKSKKAYLDSEDIREDICKVLDEQHAYIGGYKYLDGKVELESVGCFSDYDSICTTQESIYKCNVLSRVKIGSIAEYSYLLSTIEDLMRSLNEPLQGFTLYKGHDNVYYLLICSQGEYIMNPNYNKENLDAIK